MSYSLQPHGRQHSRSPHFSLKFMCTESVMLSNHLILCHSLLLLSVFPSIRVFSNELALYLRWPKYWSFSFSIGLSKEYSGLISFRIDRFDLFADQGTVKSLLQHHNSKRKHQFFSAQPSLWSNSHIIHDYQKSHSFDYMNLCWQSDVFNF